MILLYTSCYNTYSRNKEDGLLAVQISNTSPEWFDMNGVENWKQYAPEWSLINKLRNGKITADEFYDEYLSYLDRKFVKQDVIQEIYKMLERSPKGVVFLCHEGRGKVCHRYAWAVWLGLDVQEM